MQGGIDLFECFIDGAFIVEKKAETALELPGGARLPRSWQLQTAMVFLSPSALPLLGIMSLLAA